MPSCDVLIIGGGTNGLACAAALAAKGRRVVVLEAAATVGGGAAMHDFAPGYTTPSLAHSLRGLDARVAAGMQLERHGLALHPALPTTLLGSGLTVQRGRTQGPDASAFAALHDKLTHFARVLAPFRALTPPRLTSHGNEWGRLARLGLGVRALGQADFRELLRMVLINVADVAEDELTDPHLQGLLAFDATLGAWAGPRSPNTLILLLNQMAVGLDHHKPTGGMGAVAAAMARAAQAMGVDIRTGQRVARILVEGDRAVGVVAGDEWRAPLVVSAISPHTTLQTLLGPRHLDAGLFDRTRFIRARGATAKLHLSLRGAPDLPDLRQRFVIAPSVNAVEMAFNPVKYGQVPKAPVLEFVLPSAFDAGLAPPGHHVLSAHVQFAPHAPRAGLGAARAEMLANTLDVLQVNVPGIEGLITHAELLMPQDIEARFGMVGGCWHHAELSVEQMLFLRPLRELAQYQAPLPGLWLASAGQHPGGGITGAAGWNAAQRILGAT
jgi:phytoene dehydrogenase-like protein